MIEEQLPDFHGHGYPYNKLLESAFFFDRFENLYSSLTGSLMSAPPIPHSQRTGDQNRQYILAKWSIRPALIFTVAPAKIV